MPVVEPYRQPSPINGYQLTSWPCPTWQADPMPLSLRASAASNRGLVRQLNEDSVYAGDRLIAVADGMGGAPAGEVASEVAITAFRPLDAQPPADDPVAELREAFEQASAAVRAAIEADAGREGMGTTFTAMLAGVDSIGLIHVGDSRAYFLHDGELTQLTKDETYVQSLLDEGAITPEEAIGHPQRSVVTRVMQGQPTTPASAVLEPADGARFLLCSDGLSDVVPAEEVAAILGEHADGAECADQLVKAALRGGGPDNVSVIIADVSRSDVTPDDVVPGDVVRGDGAAPAENSAPVSD